MIRPGIAPSLIHRRVFSPDIFVSGNQGPATSLPGRALVHFHGVGEASTAQRPSLGGRL